ncbi:hypothetical protein HPB51_012347 [Rhipicephalus microplus]|uniref:Secreted protein n=1 Tax=Rhipicephalus microplus TaxID=6941 RepID=A0A9J6DG58_RHIMP|nr:hypothetical protein HPB51_012347 [Rhipicephalus microplus]
MLMIAMMMTIPCMSFVCGDVLASSVLLVSHFSKDMIISVLPHQAVDLQCVRHSAGSLVPSMGVHRARPPDLEEGTGCRLVAHHRRHDYIQVEPSLFL